jgi:regulator of cell morphogenesis and NO signaling
MITKENSVKEVLAHNHLLELVLDRFELKEADLRIDCSSRGKGQDVDFLVEILRIFDESIAFDAERLRVYPLPVILDYLYRTHEYYLGHRLLEIEQSVESLISNHGESYPILQLLRPFFTYFKKHLQTHIEAEEAELFPYLVYLHNAYHYGKAYAQKCGQPGLKELTDFHEDHEGEPEKGLATLRDAILGQYPEVANLLAFKVLLTQLSSFEQDLHLHERVEDEVLMPLGQQLERQLFG